MTAWPYIDFSVMNTDAAVPLSTLLTVVFSAFLVELGRINRSLRFNVW